MNWLLKLIFTCLAELLQGFIEQFGDLISNIFSTIYEMNQSLPVDSLISYSRSLAIALLTILAIKQGLDVYVFHTEGDEDADPIELITRVAISVCVIMSSSAIINEMIKIASAIANEVADQVFQLQSNYNSSSIVKENLTTVINEIVQTATVQDFIVLILLTVIITCFVVLSVQAAIRGAWLILFQILAPIFAIDIVSFGRERWKVFFKELCICTFGYILQLLSYIIFVCIFAKYVEDSSSMELLLASLGWMMISIRIPHWIKKYILYPGSGNGLKEKIKVYRY